ncbi:MAG: DUF2807 domain-containing protein [Prevotella sp.]|uniref:GIN domain-containing protein n=1 Tax=Prevotella sp. AGR2160 TaxID=1280674 RepID=UPI0003F7101E|nr:DUF2807 domain-containing protein [Prevotella sp. AGR2160]MDD5862011.1 DUF2807 domain-containing protein [Prevotella sp.]
MKKIIYTFVAFLVALCALASCKVEVVNQKDGQQAAWSVPVTAFRGIEVSGAADVTYIPSDTFSVTIKGPADERKYVSTSVNNGILKIKYDTKIFNNKIYIINGRTESLKIVVKAPTLSSVIVNGSGDFTAQSLHADSFRSVTNGSGDTKITNLQAKKVDISVNGSGDIRVGLEKVADAQVGVAGSGDINLKLRHCGKLNTSVSGAGDIKVSGDVDTWQSHTSGAGDVDSDGLTVRHQEVHNSLNDE